MIESSKQAKILVVDDDPMLLDLLTDTLTTIGYEARSAADGEQALDLLEAENFELLITDIKMPNINGIELLKQVRKKYSSMPVLFITGVASQEIIGQVSADGLLAKPFRISQIEELIENTLANKDVQVLPRMPKVLIVGDDDSFRSNLSDLLNQCRYIPFSAQDGKSAINVLESGPIDVVVTDNTLSDMPGYELSARIKMHFPNMKIVMTKKSGEPKILDSKNEHSTIDAYLNVPFSAGEFFDIIHRG